VAASIIYGFLVVGGVCLAAVGGLVLVQFLVPTNSRKRHNDVAGFIYAVLGVVYAVLLALVVIAVWEDYGRARETVEGEANATAEIFWLAHRLPEPKGIRLQELSRSYAREVVNREWPLMREGEKIPFEQEEGAAPNGWTLIDDIRSTLQEVEPGTPAEEALYAEGLSRLEELASDRRMRMVAAEESIPTVLWVVLIFGGAAAVGFTYLFGLESTWAHVLMVGTLSAVIGMVLFTIGSMEHPFSGGASIGTGAFDLVLERFETSKLSDLR
jgi:protein-S-isoprenylcysteine O-methyltransferase Ste14